MKVTNFVESEIRSQPDCWREATTVERSALPRDGESVAAVGCGTSYYMAQAYAAMRETAGLGRTDAFAASEMPPGRDYDRVLAISRSGTTTEVVDLLAALTTPSVAIIADADTPITAVADETIVLDFADEHSVVQTRFATSTLCLLRASLGEDLTNVISAGVAALSEALPHAAEQLGQFSFLGRGWTLGLANEAALKMREAALVWSDAYPAMEYRHGPISVADEQSLVWVFGAVPDGLEEQVRRTGAAFEHRDVEPLAELIRAQRLAVAIATARGIDPDRPRNLTRSVILDFEASPL